MLNLALASILLLSDLLLYAKLLRPRIDAFTLVFGILAMIVRSAGIIAGVPALQVVATPRTPCFLGLFSLLLSDRFV